MDTLYSLTLLTALLAGGVGFGLALVGVRQRMRGLESPRWLLRSTLGAVGIATVSGLVSVAVHARFGHGPGSREPMGAAAFATAHPAYLVVLLLVITAVALGAATRWRAG